MSEDKKAATAAQTDESNKNVKNPDFLWSTETLQEEATEKSGEEDNK